MLFAILLTLLMLLVISYDITQYIIPNWLIGLVLALYPVYVLLAPVPINWTAGLMIAGVVLAVGLVIFYFKLMGGGDIKLLVVCALWAGDVASIKLIFFTALLGGIMALLLLLGRPVAGYYKARIAPERLMPKILLPGEPLPYGVAIAIAMLILIWTGEFPAIKPSQGF